MSKDVAKLSVDYLFNNAIASDDKQSTVNITLFGGEPMMNFDILKYVVNYSISKKKTSGHNVSMTLITNGTIINQEMVSFFKDHYQEIDLDIQLSVDGIKETHDAYRIFFRW